MRHKSHDRTNPSTSAARNAVRSRSSRADLERARQRLGLRQHGLETVHSSLDHFSTVTTMIPLSTTPRAR